jgi:CheY-like chemotaxis protein
MLSIKVLLVDDVQLFLEFERSFFERAGCEVLTATSGKQAVDLARGERPHIILLDWQMPGMKGDEVCRILKEDRRTKHIPILVVTNFGQDEVRERCLSAGATGFVVKPIAGKELLRKVGELLEIPYRVFLRAPLSIEISMMEGRIRRKSEGYSEDVSETGMLLEAPEYIPRGAELAVEFSLPGYPGPLRLEGDVVRTFEKKARGRFGVGVRFGGMPPGAQQLLRRYVQEATR